MQAGLSRLVMALALVAASLCAAMAQDAARPGDAAPLIVGFTPIPPYMVRDEAGAHAGFTVSLARAIGEEIGVAVEFRDFPDAQALVGALTSGEAEAALGVPGLPGPTSGNLSSDPVATETESLAVLAERIDALSQVPIAGLRIGIVPPAVGSEVQALLDENTPVEFPTPDGALLALLAGEIDSILAPNPHLFARARAAGIDDRIGFLPPPIRSVERVVVLHASRADLLPALNAAIARMEADGRLAALRARYFIDLPEAPPQVLTVGVAHVPPLMIVEEAGGFSGLNVDVMRDLAARADLDLRFEAVALADWVRGPEAAGVDVIAGLVATEERRQAMDFTYPVAELGVSAIIPTNSDLEVFTLDDLRGRRVGVLANSILEATARRHGGIGVAPIADIEHLIDRLLAGEVDAILYPSNAIEDLVARSGAGDRVRILQPPVHVIETSIALRYGLGSIRAQLNGVIPGYLLSERYAATVDAYLGQPEFWTRTRVLWTVAAIAALSLAAAAGAVAYTMRTRAQAARAVAIVRDELETIFNAATSAIVALDPSGRIVRVNKQARHLLGGITDDPPFAWPASAGFLDAETMQPLEASADPVRRAMSGSLLKSETHLMRRVQAGEDRRYVRVANANVEGHHMGIHAVLVIDDVSNEERNRQVIERKNRLDALGQLTGGIAHDFNNLLASQLYALGLARKSTDIEKQNFYLETAENSIKRGRALTSRLLAFARRQPGLASVRCTAEVLQEFELLVRPMIEAHIDLRVSVDTPDLRHLCDQAQLETALMNLVLNSRDAILRSGKGSHIDIRARPVPSFDRELDTRQRAAEAVVDHLTDASQQAGASFRYVEISVTDNGPGMDSETLSRCTDPFFTTKDSNSGTGLGLAMVYGFVRQSDGDLRIYSEEGVGTTVQMTLPRGTALGAREDPMPREDIQRGGGETILVVEDELQLLAMMTKVLEDLGYTVISAGSGQEVLDLVAAGTQFDLLLTDVVMPGKIGGFELARRLRQTLPDLPVIYTSGYTGFSASEMGEVQAPLLQKPAPPAELAEAIAAALAGSRKA